jgi:hypothetical protein
MSAVCEIHRKNLVTGLKKRKESRKVGIRSGMRLNVCVISAPKLASTGASDLLDLINKFTSAVVTLAGITLGILVGKNTARCEKNCLGNDVFGCDKLDITALTRKFSATRRADFGVKILYSFKKHINVLQIKYA